MDLEKFIATNPILFFFTETFDLLSARPFQNLVRYQAWHGNIWRGTDPPDPGAARHGASLLTRLVIPIAPPRVDSSKGHF